MLKRVITAALCLCIFANIKSQIIPATPAQNRLDAFQQRQTLYENSLFKKVPFRNIGPVVQSGRVADIEVNHESPSIFLVAFASGGLWKTTSNGSEFSPLFDYEAAMTIGDIAADWDRNIIWVGTGEVNSSRSSYAGTGIYKSIDGGKTWQHKGLPESHHIGRIILHPTDPNTLWVAVMGHLYSPNAERGVYKTTDGGNSWQKVLYIDDQTGAVDLLPDPANPDILYAAMWHRERYAWNFVESGKTSSIYKSVDGGNTWSDIIANGKGFPTGDGVGRIGLACGQKNGKTILYAVLDNQTTIPPKEDKKVRDELTKDDLRNISKEDFLKTEPKKIEMYLKKYDFPSKYKAEEIIRLVRNDKLKPQALVDYLENANNQLFDTEITGAEIYRSEDNGFTWTKQHEKDLKGLFYTYGYYFGQIRVASYDPDKVYVLGVPILRSDNAGSTWKSMDADNVHGDHHALWVNPNLPGHLINGNDGGVNISYDDGKTWFKCNTPPVGQFYAVNADQAEPYNVYGGLQDNGVWVGSHQSEPNTYWHQSGHYEFKEIIGGDGMQVMIDPRDNNTVYTGYQFGNYYRINKNTERSDYITPTHDLGERPLRFNWQTPIWLSEHNPDILYMGAQRLYRSMNKGKEWMPISDDLTKGGKKGDVPYGTISSIHESPLKFGLIYVGTDDGNVWVTKDGGDIWIPCNNGLPSDLWVSRVIASTHEKGRAYVALNGYRLDHFEAYLYVTEDYGANWERIGTDLPGEPVNVVKEDPVNAEILYVGTDHGLYISVHRGKSFQGANEEMPAVAVHDLVVQEQSNDLIVGTHGRSIFIYPLEHIQALTDTVLEKNLYVMNPEKVFFSSNWGKSRSSWDEIKEPELVLPFYLKDNGTVNISVRSEGGKTLKKWSLNATSGLNYPVYNLDVEEASVTALEKEWQASDEKGKEKKQIIKADNGKYYLVPGKYTLTFESRNVTVEKELIIRER